MKKIKRNYSEENYENLIMMLKSLPNPDIITDKDIIKGQNLYQGDYYLDDLILQACCKKYEQCYEDLWDKFFLREYNPNLKLLSQIISFPSFNEDEDGYLYTEKDNAKEYLITKEEIYLYYLELQKWIYQLVDNNIKKLIAVNPKFKNFGKYTINVYGSFVYIGISDVVRKKLIEDYSWFIKYNNFCELEKQIDWYFLSEITELVPFIRLKKGNKL